MRKCRTKLDRWRPSFLSQNSLRILILDTRVSQNVLLDINPNMQGWNWGYIVKNTPANVFVVLKADLFREDEGERIVKMENESVKHVCPFVVEVEEVGKNIMMTLH